MIDINATKLKNSDMQQKWNSDMQQSVKSGYARQIVFLLVKNAKKYKNMDSQQNWFSFDS